MDDVDDAGFWDFARLVLLGPLLVPEECRHEAAILASAVDATDGTDHELVLQQLLARVDARQDPAWLAVGCARFCEEYLEQRLTKSSGHLTLLDIGLDFVERQGLLSGNISPACLSAAERDRLRHRANRDAGS